MVPEKVSADVPVHEPRPKPVMLVPKRFVKVPEGEKKLVVVAWVPVAFINVKFWSVVEPVTRSWLPIFAKGRLGSK